MSSENKSNVRKIDKYQRAAIDTAKNSVVSAGAGSGKTTVLSERFTDLVINRNCKVEEILTLTFTKKATVEMSSRIYKVLKEKAPQQAEEFYKANIKTLDSYCNSVAKAGAYLYGITPDFTQDEEAITQLAHQAALPFILQHRDNLAIKALVSTKNYEEIASQLFVESIMENSTVAEPIDFDKCLGNQKAEIISVWREETKLIDDLFCQLENALNDFEGNRTIKFITALTPLIDQGLPEAPVLTDQIIEASNKKTLSAMADYTNAVNTLAYVSQTGTRENSAALKEILNQMRGEAGILISVINFVSGYAITKELLPLLKEFQDKINNIKRSTGVLSFKDIANLAVCILRDYPEIRQIEKERYRAIMIDEFQDNNQQQRDMLFMLAEKLERHEKGVPEVQDLCPEKLFFVGDEKQSIYRFRGADVSVFRALSKDFKDGNLSMSTNYRSHPSLITAFNTIFGGPRAVFYTEADEKDTSEPLPDYEAVYHNVTIPEDKAKEVSQNPDLIKTPHIHIARYDSAQEAGYSMFTEEDAEAIWIAKKIAQLTTEGVNGKVYKPDDIAILMRSYSLQPLYERTLLNYGIPYNTETVTGFFADGPVNDIISFLSICINDNDSISYAQVLRSPFVNLSIEETDVIILAGKKPFECSEDELTGFLTPESLNHYSHTKAFFEKMREAVKSEPVTKLVTMLWYDSGYRFETLWNNKVNMYGKLYDLLFELAHNAEQNNLNLSAFIDSVRTYTDERSKLENMDIPLEQSSGVHILTIHKSKGLEYKVVFICATHKKGMNDTNTSPVFSSPEYGITINTPPSEFFPGSKSNYFYDKMKTLNTQMKNAELRRLTYVALTRAIDELYITNGKYSLNKNAETSYCPGADKQLDSIYHALEPSINYFEGDTFDGIKFYDTEDIPPYTLEETEAANDRQNNARAKAIFIDAVEKSDVYENAELIITEAVPDKYASPSQLHKFDDESYNTSSPLEAYTAKPGTPYPEINKIIIASIPKKNGKPIPKAEPRFAFTNFGTIAHAYMEAVITGEKASYSNKDIVGLENNEKNLKTIVAVCEEMQQKLRDSELGKAAINAGWHKAEYPFRSRIGSKIIKGIIDLVFQNADGTYTIVDYKTNQTIAPELYYNQLACYRQAVAAMLNVSAAEIKCVLYYLRFGQAVDITEECTKVDLEKVVAELE